MFHSGDFVETVVRDRTAAAMELSMSNQQLGLTPTVKESMTRVASWFRAAFRRIGIRERRAGERLVENVENIADALERRTADRRVASIPVPLERRITERRMAAA